MSRIIQLSDNTISKIAAGEVIERPASVVKELVENSIDAKSSSITVTLEEGGRNLISVQDDGIGIEKLELGLAVSRHATSKLNEKDIFDINSLGFRGEALASIAAVSEMEVSSRYKGSEDSWTLLVDAKLDHEIIPSKRQKGTEIKVQNLFCTTPSRLRFLKSVRSETMEVVKFLKKISIYYPEIAFKLLADGKELVNYPKSTMSERIEAVLGEGFIDNSIELNAQEDNFSMLGYIGVPTFHKANSMRLYLYVNGRPIKDTLLLHAVKTAYANLMPPDKYPMGVIFLEVDNHFVDVNVHPTKIEVRFQDEQYIKRFVINKIRGEIAITSPRTSSFIVGNAINMIRSAVPAARSNISSDKNITELSSKKINFESDNEIGSKLKNNRFDDKVTEVFNKPETEKDIVNAPVADPKVLKEDCVLGFAIGQIDNTYIIAKSHKGLVLVDQHAAHERILLHEIRQQVLKNELKRQVLVVPHIMEFSEEDVEVILKHKDELLRFGFLVEKNGAQVLVREIPLLAADLDIREFFETIIGDIDKLESKVDYICGNIACRRSIRSGRVLKEDEMNSILRKIENTPFADQCNHGRPTHLTFTHKDLEKMFERC